MTHTHRSLPLLLLCLSLLAAPSRAAEVTADADAATLLVTGAERLKVSSMAMDVRLEVHRKDHVKVVRFQTRASDRDPAISKSWLLQTEPELMAGRQFLVLKGPDKARVYQYIVNTEPVEIGGAANNQRLFGSTFRLKDFKAMEIDEGQHKRVGEQQLMVDGKQHTVYVVESVVKAGEHRTIRRYLDKEELLPLRIDFFDAAGTETKRMTVLKTARAGDIPVALQTRMENLLVRGEYSDLFLESYRFNLSEADLPESTFTKAHMKEVGARYK